VRIRITEMLLGLEPDQKEIVVETGLGGGDCGYDFRRGFDWIGYASKKPGGGLSASICTPTRLVENAAEDLKYFHQLAQASPVAEIRVMAWDVHGARVNMRELPVLAGAHVTVDGPGVHESATTDAAGRYVFSNLLPGEYTVSGASKVHDPKPPAGRCTQGCAEVALLHNSIACERPHLGKDGRPAAGVIVEAVPRRQDTKTASFAADSSTTDENGRYELRRLTTGDYYLGISLSRSHVAESHTRGSIPVRRIRALQRWCMCPINPRFCGST
jgi:hypothetical protein